VLHVYPTHILRFRCYNNNNNNNNNNLNIEEGKERDIVSKEGKIRAKRGKHEGGGICDMERKKNIRTMKRNKQDNSM
jgi:hypothetical protein